jgi:hypothetical protein
MRREPGTGPRQVYVHLPTWKEFVKLCRERNLKPSKRLRQIIHDDVNKMKGTSTPQPVNYDELKQQHHAFILNIDKLEKTLRKHGVYDQLVDLAENLKIDKTNFSNLKTVVRDMFNQWEGHHEELHLFVSLLELVKEKRSIEKQLLDVRTNEFSE